MQDRGEGPRADVEVWTGRPRDVDPGSLSAEERRRMGLFHFARDARSYGTAHLLLRQLLSKWGGAESSEWRFRVADFGKPYLDPAHGSELGFNLSHARGLVAVAVTRGREIGVDVEGVAARSTALELSERVLSPFEAAAFHGLAKGDQARRFFAIWSLKEAYIKARGLGLRLPLKEISFGFEGGDPRLIETPAAGPDRPEGWQIEGREVDSHAFGLCVARRGDEPVLSIDVRHLKEG